MAASNERGVRRFAAGETTVAGGSSTRTSWCFKDLLFEMDSQSRGSPDWRQTRPIQVYTPDLVGLPIVAKRAPTLELRNLGGTLMRSPLEQCATRGIHDPGRSPSL